MKVEIIDTQTIELTPENKLEAAIAEHWEWSVKKVPPKPLENNVTKLRLTCQLPAAKDGRP